MFILKHFRVGLCSEGRLIFGGGGLILGGFIPGGLMFEGRLILWGIYINYINPNPNPNPALNFRCLNAEFQGAFSLSSVLERTYICTIQ